MVADGHKGRALQASVTDSSERLNIFSIFVYILDGIVDGALKEKRP
jgi:hypothetical protein